jgi:hypothetical protein
LQHFIVGEEEEAQPPFLPSIAIHPTGPGRLIPGMGRGLGNRRTAEATRYSHWEKQWLTFIEYLLGLKQFTCV